jgi:hypothetical protein
MKLPSLLTLMFILVLACGGASESVVEPQEQLAKAVSPPPTVTPLPSTVTPILTPVPELVPTPIETAGDEFFWNEPMAQVTQKCSGDFTFTHKIIDLEDSSGISFGPGSHIAPHEHMAYWGVPKIEGSNINATGTQVSERVQIYSPTDIFYIDLRKLNRTTGESPNEIRYVEWGGYLYTCNGHQIMFGHLSEPSDELRSILSKNEPQCDEQTCIWSFPTFIPSGTPLFMTSGFAGAFDFGLSLAGLTVEELQGQPGYGYSMTPWRTHSGNSVCPQEYFIEPLRSEYMKLLGDFQCGPFNQDVDGTAMGFWFPSSSPEIVPLTPSERDVDEWETIWLFQDFRDSSEYIISVGNNTFGLDYGQYSYVSSETGLVNRKWDQVKSGQTYCMELRIEDNHDDIPNIINKIILLELSQDGTQLAIEAIDGISCGEDFREFQGGERIFYR